MKNVKTNKKTVATKAVKRKKTIGTKEALFERHFENAQRIKVAVDQIDCSPYNRRKFFKQKDMEELAENIKIHGVIQDIGVRTKEDGRYELVFGERRWRASQLAGLTHLHVKCATIPDEVVKEIMLSENIHRENQHPMDEAFSIGGMLGDGKTPDEIAARLGKSKNFVFSRAKLLSLIEPVQEIFFHDKIGIADALQIATLSEDSQQDFFSSHCEGWQNAEDFELDNLHYILRHYRYELSSAPFDTACKKLLKKAGPCTTCPFNTATLTSLFPEDAEDAICTSKNCFEAKCKAHYAGKLQGSIQDHRPQALVLGFNLLEPIVEALSESERAKALPRYDRNSISLIDPPIEPTKEEYSEEGSDNLEPFFDEEGYNAAVQEYEDNKAEFQRMLDAGMVQKGLYITNKDATPYYFSQSAFRLAINTPKVTAKQVQEAIKTGEVTPDLLNAEIERLTTREKRAKEIDEERIQNTVHKAFKEHIGTFPNNKQFTEADALAARLLVYQSLNYSCKSNVDTVLGIPHAANHEELVMTLKGLDNLQYAYLIRMALAGKSESNQPGTATGICLRIVAESAEVNVQKIVSDQRAVAATREQNVNTRIESLQERTRALSTEEGQNAA